MNLYFVRRINFFRRGKLVVTSLKNHLTVDGYIHIIVKPPIPHLKFDFVCKVGLLNEGDDVEYLEKNRYYKVTLHEGYLCNKDGKYNTFTEFLRAARKLNPSEQVSSYYFYNLKINGITYSEVRDKIYKLIFCNHIEGNLFTMIIFNQNQPYFYVQIKFF